MSSPQKPSPQPWNFIGCSGASQIPENFIERGTNPSQTSLSLVPPFANSPPQSRRRRILSGGGDQRRAGQISKRRMMRGRPCLCGFCQSPCHIYFRYTSRPREKVASDRIHLLFQVVESSESNMSFYSIRVYLFDHSIWISELVNKYVTWRQNVMKCE